MTRPRAARSAVPLSVLIADDDEGDRKQIKRLLSVAGILFDSIEVVSIAEALAACETSDFDCAFVDYQMPGYDGLEGISLLHKRLPFMSIVMVTGHGDETIATEAMKRGAADYIGKRVITADALKRVVTSAMEKASLWRLVAAQREQLENFASIIAHDLNAPIASIQLFVQTIADELGSEEPDYEEIVELCRSTVGAAEQAGALVETIHRYTKADAVVVVTRVDMRLVMSSALTNLKLLIDGRGALVTFGELPLVIGDPSLLTQLLQNLIGNAIKYCTQPIPTVHLTVVKDADDWLFSMTDNGIGILKEQSSKIFEPFTRLHVDDQYEGTGLGLAICRKVVERHGGSIWCRSPGVGQGSTFLFKLHGADPIYSGMTNPPLQELQSLKGQVG